MDSKSISAGALERPQRPDSTGAYELRASEREELRGGLCGVSHSFVGAIDLDLTALIEAWPSLPEAIKAGVLALVQAAQEAEQ